MSISTTQKEHAGMACRTLLRSALVLTVVATGTALPATAQAAGRELNADSYALSVEGDGLAMTVVDNALPFTNTYTVSPYSALSALNSTGLSTAQAGAPYPGFFGPLYRNVNGLIYGEVPPLPPLPGNAASNYPAVTSEREATAAGYTLSANSSATRSTALVNMGAAGQDAKRGVSFASADTVADPDGTIRALGSAGTELLNVENVVSIANVSSTAGMEIKGTGSPVVKTETHLGSITVGGFPVALTPEGVRAAGNDTPAGFKDANDQINRALSSSGITLRYLPSTIEYVPGTRTVKSVTSGAVQLTMLVDEPTQGKTTYDFVLGRVFLTGSDASGAAVTSGPAPAGGPATGAPPPTSHPTAASAAEQALSTAPRRS
ncbi:MAG TPA: hypothetical protein VHY21_15415 [Pseudonocardiaceae bacterium]|jgi:hypothetical protein|nr:hypothetical protein [Pseudonocardiaceae bacterium]